MSNRYFNTFYSCLIWILFSGKALSEPDAPVQTMQFQLPLRMTGLLSEMTKDLSPAIKSIEEKLSKLWFDSHESIDKSVLQKNLNTENKRIFAHKILAGTSKVKSVQTHFFYLDPHLDKFSDHLILRLNIGSLEQNLLVASAHRAISLKDVSHNFKSETRISEIFIESNIKSLFEELIESVDDYQKSVAMHPAFKVGLSLARSGMRFDEGEDKTLLSLLAQNLIKNRFPVVNFLSGESVSFLRQITAIETPLARATRTIVADWNEISKTQRIGKKSVRVTELPQDLQSSLRFSESVFGNPFDRQSGFITKVEFNSQSSEIDMKLPDAFWDLIESERRALAINDKPQIAYIDRAWAYLDRGRAYGLKINDRILVEGKESEIKGHVVGYFGPNLKLKSPRGFNIHEGAIVYIRKGQSLMRTGQSIELDPQTFPTNWPPN